MTAIALIASELPLNLLEVVEDRIHDRAGCREVRFDWWREPCLLPVRWDGSLRLVSWGSKVRRSRLPQGYAVSRAQVESGLFANAGPEEVTIPASFGYHRGTWFLIEEGVRGVLLAAVPGGPVVYLLVEPASNYYRNMTGQSPLMPVFLHQTI